jgi:hypothetical protein
MEIAKSQKKRKKYECKSCDYYTYNKYDFTKHNDTIKHKNNQMAINVCDLAISLEEKSQNKIFMCNICNKEYKDNSGLWKHKKKCKIKKYDNENNICQDETKTGEIEELKTFMQYLMKENSEMKNIMMEIIKNGTHNTIHTNSHNKSFNLQFFLNETCKNAMNITDFVNSLQLQLCDLEKVGELGYVEGISNIIIKNLNAMDVTLRPVHCTDKKRETMYVKDENKWEKDDDNKSKLHKMVRKVSNKNIDLISEFKELHPDWKKSTSKVSDQFDKIIIESMGGTGDNDYEKEEKIIKKISKAVFVDKVL